MDRRTIENHLTITSLDEVIEGLVDNMDDEEIDRYVRLCNTICRKLGIPNQRYSDCIVLIDKDDSFHPIVVSDIEQEDKSRRITSARVYGIPMVWENDYNGARWCYFKSEEDALDYVTSYIEDIYDGDYNF